MWPIGEGRREQPDPDVRRFLRDVDSGSAAWSEGGEELDDCESWC